MSFPGNGLRMDIYVLVNAEHVKVDWITPCRVVPDVVSRYVEAPRLEVLFPRQIDL